MHLRSFGWYAAAGILSIAVAAIATRTRVDAQARGKSVYDAHCAECHGSDGKGGGPGAAYLTPRPRDFSSAKYKIRSTETGSVRDSFFSTPWTSS